MSEYSSSIPDDASESLGLEDAESIDFPKVNVNESPQPSIQISFSKAREHLEPPQLARNETNGTAFTIPKYKLTSGFLSYLPDQSSRLQMNKTSHFNFIVAGRSGLGKSTFIRMLLHPGAPVEPLAAGDTKYPTKSTQINLQRYYTDNYGIKADLSAIDTPGFGEYIDNRNCWVPICNYIDKQHMIYMYQEEQPERSKLFDTRVNACIYFIEHTGRMLSNLDITAMKEISLRANLIPVIAKSDCITNSEMSDFKLLVQKQLDTNDIKVFQDLPPFGISCSDTQAMVDGKNCFVRSYPYGNVNCEDTTVSDFTALRNLLLTRSTLDLIDATHSVYYRYQRVVLMQYRYRKSSDISEDENIIGKPPLELLKAIKGVTMSALIKEHLEKDPLFLQQVAQVKSRYDQVGSNQIKQFSEYQQNLHAKQLDCEKELKQIRYDINDLKERIRATKMKHK